MTGLKLGPASSKFTGYFLCNWTATPGSVQDPLLALRRNGNRCRGRGIVVDARLTRVRKDALARGEGCSDRTRS